MFDVLALGAVAIDQLVFVEAFPPPNVKTVVIRTEQQCGGLSATALVAAARLGAQCAYAGLLGNDDGSRFAMDAMRHEGIDLTHVVKQADAGPIRSVIIVGEKGHTRNIFPAHPAFTGAHATLPDAHVIRSARVLHVDHVGPEGMVRAAQIARTAQIAVVSDIERNESPLFETLLGLVDHVVMSEEFARQLLGTDDPAQAALGLWTPARATVAITCGDRGCYYTDDGTRVSHQPAFEVAVVDTTGCGDVFHGGYCAALARNMALDERIRFASAAAALKATQPGAQAGAPTLAQVENFLQKTAN